MRLFQLTALIGLICAGSAAAASLSPANLEQQFNREKPEQVVAQLARGSSGSWDQVLANISSGDEHWLKLAPRLWQGTDGGRTYELRSAISSAIMRNPRGVLEITGDQISIGEVCADLSIEPSKAEVREFVRKSLSALNGVTRKDLIQSRDRCMTAFKSADGAALKQ